jgi:tRNA threonylcarbamoyladenosine biosynthesis protein TsaB
VTGGRPDLLALHTTEPVGSVAAARGGRIVSTAFRAQGQHAPVLLASVLDLLRGAGVELAAVRGIAVTVGPGSFTGIRVGLATAQGLAAARGLPVYACDSLQARAATQRGGAGPHAVVLDARRGQVYAALYDVAAPVPAVLVPPFAAAPEVAAARLAAAAGDAGLTLVGDGAGLLHEALRGTRLRVETREEAAGAPPVAAALLELAWGGGCATTEPADLQPLYLRKSDAETRREAPRPPA